MLAELLSGKSNIPEEALKVAFGGAMIAAQTILCTQIDPSIKNRVWTHISKKYLNSLKAQFLSQVHSYIRGDFRNGEIEEMCEEQADKNFIIEGYGLSIQTAQKLFYSIIPNVLRNEANSISMKWNKDIFGALKNEGITFPQVKKAGGIPRQ